MYRSIVVCSKKIPRRTCVSPAFFWHASTERRDKRGENVLTRLRSLARFMLGSPPPPPPLSWCGGVMKSPLLPTYLTRGKNRRFLASSFWGDEDDVFLCKQGAVFWANKQEGGKGQMRQQKRIFLKRGIFLGRKHVAGSDSFMMVLPKVQKATHFGSPPNAKARKWLI